MENEIDLCILKGGDKWFELSRWLRERNFLIGKKRSQCYNLGRIISRGDRPSEALSMAGVRIWSEAEVRGWNRIETLILNNLNDQRTIDVEN
jgi:hypothetical protein